MLKVILLITIAITLSLAVPCGRCFVQGAECAGDVVPTGRCFRGYTCRVLEHGLSAHCWATLKVGDECDPENPGRGPPCPTDSHCSDETKKCENDDMASLTNDGCHTNSDCVSNAVFDGSSKCSDSVCESTETCEKIGCPLYQYCDLADNTCKDVPVAGEDCLDTGLGSQVISSFQCWKSSCIGDVCQDPFTAIEGGECSSTFDCEAGLVCEFDIDEAKSICKAPKLELLSKHERIRWGPNCNPAVDQTGCECHETLNVYKFLMEENPSAHTSCAAPYSNFWDCLKNAECFSVTTDFNSCLRRKCWNQYRTAIRHCFADPSRVPDECKAGTFTLALILLILAVLFN